MGYFSLFEYKLIALLTKGAATALPDSPFSIIATTTSLGSSTGPYPTNKA